MLPLVGGSVEVAGRARFFYFFYFPLTQQQRNAVIRSSVHCSLPVNNPPSLVLCLLRTPHKSCCPRCRRSVFFFFVRIFHTNPQRFNAPKKKGGIGQPLSLLLKADPLVTSLSLYDIRGAPGVAADVSHVDTASEVVGYAQEQLAEALNGVKVVVIPAGVPRKPGMTRDDLFNTNASIVRDLARAVSENAPDAHVLIISSKFLSIVTLSNNAYGNPTVIDPVNSTVPIVAETLKKAGTYNPKKVYGITTLDVVRASRFLASVKSTDPADTIVSVVGGHSGVTIVPLLSQSEVGIKVQQGSTEWAELVKRIQFGGDEVVKAKDGAGSATLSMAYGTRRNSRQIADN